MKKIDKLFNDFKNEIIKRCKEHSACESEFKRVLVSENFEQITKVLTDNFYY
jgi:stress-induced morphogen